MNDNKFIKYETIANILNKNGYYGLTVSRINDHSLRRKFSSIKWYTIDIVIESIKLKNEGEIVSKIIVNGEETNGMDNFKRRIEGLGRLHAQKRKQEVR